VKHDLLILRPAGVVFLGVTILEARQGRRGINKTVMLILCISIEGKEELPDISD